MNPWICLLHPSIDLQRVRSPTHPSFKNDCHISSERGSSVDVVLGVLSRTKTRRLLGPRQTINIRATPNNAFVVNRVCHWQTHLAASFYQNPNTIVLSVVFQPKTAKWNPLLNSGATLRLWIRQQTDGAVLAVATQSHDHTTTITSGVGIDALDALALQFPAAQPLAASHKPTIHFLSHKRRRVRIQDKIFKTTYLLL